MAKPCEGHVSPCGGDTDSVAFAEMPGAEPELPLSFGQDGNRS